ncbi:MAG: 16S rRNA (uracil(1498)-N(3))-methyltransferase [Treponema sp.]|jgi:16S rRNA (uracil1498-N3)-methyltransferase|nr:16S rRNA (uracil(1498)-N(3))-methyltransferase [Treponema sp.]
MKQFILSAMPDTDGRVYITGKDFHYLSRVKRLRPGAVFDVLFPNGEAAQIGVVSLRGGCLTGERLPPEGLGTVGNSQEETGTPAMLLPPLALFQALPKGAKMDLIIRQAAEGGVTEIVPFVSAYSVSRPEDTACRLERWRRIIREARQQSGSGTATAVREPAAFDALLEYWEGLKGKYERPVGLLFHQNPLEQGSFHRYLDKCPDLVVFVVGPEGGFSPEEVSRCMAAGFKPLTLGDTVLRVETAALYAQAVIRIILLESASWMPKLSR